MEQSRYASAASPGSSEVFRATPQDLYNDLGKTYEDAYINNEGQAQSLQWLISQLPKRATVLDMGCGTGKPASKTLSDAGLVVTGIDISSVMLSHARTSVPAATFIEADILDFTPLNEVDAVVAYYSLIGHVSQDQIRCFFKRVHGFLKPGGFFIYATVSLEGDNVMTKWMNRELYCSSFNATNAVAEVKAAGFDVVKCEETMFVPRNGAAQLAWEEQVPVLEEPHVFVYARKSAGT